MKRELDKSIAFDKVFRELFYLKLNEYWIAGDVIDEYGCIEIAKI